MSIFFQRYTKKQRRTPKPNDGLVENRRHAFLYTPTFSKKTFRRGLCPPIFFFFSLHPLVGASMQTWVPHLLSARSPQERRAVSRSGARCTIVSRIAPLMGFSTVKDLKWHCCRVQHVFLGWETVDLESSCTWRIDLLYDPRSGWGWSRGLALPMRALERQKRAERDSLAC